MRINFHTNLGHCGDHPERETQRLMIWAAALERLGHDVALGPAQFVDPRWSRYIRKPLVAGDADATIILASCLDQYPPRAVLKYRPGILVVAQPVGRKILEPTAWDDADFIIGSPNDTLPPYKEFAAERIAKLGQRYLGVHFPPFGRTLETFDRDGMLEAYINDDLEAIRAKYGSSDKKYDIGYRGNTINQQTPGEPIRAQIFAYYETRPRFEFHSVANDPSWYDRTADYLRFLSECRLTMALVGDRIKTHRHVEAPMMGSPVCVVKGQLDVTPIHDGNNSVLLGHWFDEWSAVLGLDRDYGKLLAASDEAYCSGWSLRGQMRTLLERIEACHQSA